MDSNKPVETEETPKREERRPPRVPGEYGMLYAAARRTADANYAYGHDNRLWAIV